MTNTLQVFAYILTYVTFSLSIGSCLSRVYCCKFVTHKWRPDDYMGIVVGFTLIGALVFWQLALSMGCGGPEPNKCNFIGSESRLLWYLYITSIYYLLMHFLIKAAFLTLYLRFSPSNIFQIWVGIGFGLNLGLLISNLLIMAFQCIPVSAAFDLFARRSARCMHPKFVLFAPAAINVFLDTYVFLLPIPMLAKVKVPARRKLVALPVFACGGAAVILGIIRFYTLTMLDDISSTSFGVGVNIIVASLELNLAVIAVNLPAIRLIWVKRSKTRQSGTWPPDWPAANKRKVSTDLGIGRERRPHERSSVSNPLRDSPLTPTQEKIWMTISGDTFVHSQESDKSAFGDHRRDTLQYSYSA